VIFFCLLFIFYNTLLHSQQIIHLDSKDGLINGTINAFERDSLGYMWIGTDQGINRYSGVEFKNYDLDDNNKIKGKEIIDLLNVNGNLYAISSGGSLIKYYYEKDRFEELYTETKNRFFFFNKSKRFTFTHWSF